MGVVADAVLDGGGEVIGVIPQALATKEVLHVGVADMRRVRDMHERKALMAELSDAFLALPGGLGTFEEFFEIVTWAQLGFHRKTIGLLNVEGYFDPLVTLIEHAIECGLHQAGEPRLDRGRTRARRRVGSTGDAPNARRPPLAGAGRDLIAA